MSGCSPLFANVFVDCDFPPARSQSIAYLINYDDILYVEFEGYPPQEIRTIGEHKNITKLYLKPSTYVYTLQGKDNTVDAGYYEFELLYSDVFAHFVDLKVFNSDNSSKEILEQLSKGKYVMIVGGEVYGIYSGLVLMEKEKDLSADNNYTFFSLSFETDNHAAEPHLPPLYLGDIAWLETDHWILWNGEWDDSGIWMDDQTWNE